MNRLLVTCLLVVLSWLFPRTLNSLPPRTGVLIREGHFALYTNVQHCGKVVSITVEHLSGNIKAIYPEIEPIVVDEAADIAIYPMLGSSDITKLADYSAVFKGSVYSSYTYIYWLETYTLLRFTYSGIIQSKGWILLQGPVWFGASGSGVFNEAGDFVGSLNTIILGPGPNGIALPTGLATMTNYYHIKDLLDTKVCALQPRL